MLLEASTYFILAQVLYFLATIIVFLSETAKSKDVKPKVGFDSSLSPYPFPNSDDDNEDRRERERKQRKLWLERLNIFFLGLAIGGVLVGLYFLPSDTIWIALEDGIVCLRIGRNRIFFSDQGLEIYSLQGRLIQVISWNSLVFKPKVKPTKDDN